MDKSANGVKRGILGPRSIPVAGAFNFLFCDKNRSMVGRVSGGSSAHRWIWRDGASYLIPDVSINAAVNVNEPAQGAFTILATFVYKTLDGHCMSSAM